MILTVRRWRGVWFGAAALALATSVGLGSARAQDDLPLGDIARNLRKSKEQQQKQTPDQVSPPVQSPPVIDNDNLSAALDELTRFRPNRFVFSIDSAGKNLKVSAPDVTCSLSFNARAASLLIKPVIVQDLPPSELAKVDGPASIQDENLQLQVFNGTEWELREITVGISLERQPGENAAMGAGARVIPAAESLAPPNTERRSDITTLYHLTATAKPFTTTTFREAIGITLGAEQDWHWSIVGAKGIRPEGSPPPAEMAPFSSPPFPPSLMGAVKESSPATEVTAPVLPAQRPSGFVEPVNRSDAKPAPDSARAPEKAPPSRQIPTDAAQR